MLVAEVSPRMRPSIALIAVISAGCAATDGSSDSASETAGSEEGGGGEVSGPQDGGAGAGQGAGEQGGAAGDGGGIDPAPEEPPALPAFVPGEVTLHRLTNSQYRNSLRDLLGAAAPLAPDLEPDTSLHGFTAVGATELTVSPRGAELYEEVARQAGASTDTGCAGADSDCLKTWLRTFLRRAWRRPAEPAEVDAMASLSATVEEAVPGQGPAQMISAALQSPWFLFRVEQGEVDPDSPGSLRFTDWEMATRLSYALWESTPDDALLDAASRGELTTDDGLKAQAERLLASPQARRGLARFFEEHLTLDRLSSMTKDPSLFPQMSPTLAESMRKEVLDVIDWLIFEEDGDFLDVLTTTTTFVDGELAALYGLPWPGEGSGHRVEQPEGSPRGGLLGMAALLALNAHPAVTSPTLRGRFVQQNLRCVDIPPPPPGVVTNLDAGEGGAPLTVREKLEAHRADPTCAGCHSAMDPIGIGLESFDAIGAYRTTDAGRPVDARSELDGTVFDGPAQLGMLLRDDPKVTACLARRFYRYATGHLEERTEEGAVRALGQEFDAAGRRVQALVMQTVLSDGFRKASAPAEEDE